METKRFGSAVAAALALGMLLAGGAWAAVGDIVTIAGTGTAGFSGDGGPATSAQLNTPLGVVEDSAGNTYIADMGNNRIRKIDPSGTITTVAGNGTWAYAGDGGPATSGSLKSPYAVAVDSAGNIYIADTYNHRIRKVNTSGVITTVAGSGTQGFSGDGGPATSASFWAPYGVAVDSGGNIYIADTGNSVVRKVDTSGVISSIISPGAYGIPYGVAVDSAGNVYFSDAWNTHRIYKVATSGSVSAVAGNGTGGYSGDGGSATSASLYLPTGVAVDAAGNIYIADNGNNRIRKVDTSGVITTVAGNGTAGYSGDGGPATSAALRAPFGVAIGTIIIPDSDNHAVRHVVSVTGDVSTQYILYVRKTGTGSGSVTSASGIDCGSDCEEAYDRGASVTLRATADPGSTFAGWNDPGCSGTGPCTVVMQTSRIVTPTFDAGAPDISVSPFEINFGGVRQQTTSQRTITVTNKGTASLFLLLTEVVSIGGTFTGVSNCPDFLSSGDSCTLSVSFNPPSGVSAYFALALFDSDDPETPHVVVNLWGAGVAYANSDTKATLPAATGTGDITVDTSATPGTVLSDVGSLKDTDSSLNQTGKPADMTFKHGVLDFRDIFNDGSTGGTAQVKLTFPDIPSGSKLYTIDSSGFHEFNCNAVWSGNDVTISLTDGGCGDGDGVANGAILDPIGLGSPSGGSGSTLTTVNFGSGWNLVGNSASGALDVAATFGDANKVTTVWKWIAAKANWAFYTPLQGDGGAAYAAGKGYDFLGSVSGGEGFWVNAKASFSAQLPAGTAITSASFKTMGQGWNLISVGDSPTPSAFNKALSASQPAAGEIPLNLTTLWAWDATQSNWYFYAPSLEKNGTLSAYIQSKSYLDFGTKVLDPAMGFWVNKP